MISYMYFYRDMGYSLCGFEEVFGHRGLYGNEEDDLFLIATKLD